MKIDVPDYLKVWDEIDSFTLNWEIEITSFSYNKDIIISKLKKIIRNNIINESERIISINWDDLRIPFIIKRNDLKKIKWTYEYVQKLSKPLNIKWTTEIEYYISKSFKNDNTTLNFKIKSQIMWLPLDQAETILINNPEINNVKIDVQPFFINKISNIPQNIHLKIID
jgi:hypothetical protein